MGRIIVSCAVIILLFVSCAAAGKPVAASRERGEETLFCEPAPQHGGKEVAALTDLFFSVGPRPGDFDRLLAAALERYPGNYQLHEMAAWWALVRGDRRAANEHLARALCDLSSPYADLYLYQLSRDLAGGEKRRFVPLLTLLGERHPDPIVRSVASAVAADLLIDLGQIAEVRRIADRIGYLGDWMVIGTFDNDQGKGFYEAYPPEQEIDFGKRYKGQSGEIGWMRVMPIRHDRFLSFKNLLYPDNWSVAYLVTHVEAAEERDALLLVSTGNPTAVWVGGKQVYANDKLERFFYDTIRVPIRLAKGWNRILVKSAAENDSWLFAARLAAPDGTPLTTLRVAADAGGAPLAAPVSQPAAPEEIAARQPTFPEQNRAFFLQALRAEREGDRKRAKQAILSFYEGNPDNPFAMFLAAKTFRENDEEGQLIDLLNRTIDTNGIRTAGFLIQRGDFFRRKGIRDNAEEDYRTALALEPNAEGAYWGVAEVLGERGLQKDRCDTFAAMAARWPDDADIIRSEADCLNARGYERDAEARFRAALAVEPGRLATIRRLVSQARSRQDYAGALALVNIMALISPDNPDYPMEQGELLRRLKRYDEARRAFERAAALAPYEPGPYQSLGDLAWERGMREEALRRWREALDRNPRNASLADKVAYLTAAAEKDPAEAFVPNDEEIRRLIAAARAVTPDPAAKALMVYDHAVVQVNDDGSAKWYITEVKLVVNDAGRDILINENLPYTGSVKIRKAYSLDPGGVRQEASSIRGSQIRFRQLDKGSATVVQYVHYSPALRFLENHFLAEWYLQTTYYQMLHSELRLIYDPKREMVFDVRGAVEEKTESFGNRTMKIFIARNRPPLSPEPMMPPVGDLLEQITVSSVKSWDEYVNWERALLKKAFVSNKEVRDLAVRLTSGKETPREKLDALFRFVAQEIRYQQDYETTIAGVKPHTPTQILERRYGDCKDKAVLIIQLAKEIGIKLEYAILRTRDSGKLQMKIPNQQFNHAIVHVPVQPGIESDFFMDPTVDLLEIGTLRSDDQGAMALVMDPDTAAWRFLEIPYQPPAFNFEEHDTLFTVSESGTVTVRSQITVRGPTSSSIRRTLRTQRDADKLFQGIVNSLFRGGTLIKAEHGDIEDISKPLTLVIEADVSNLLSTQEGGKRLLIPASLIGASTVKLTSRALPMDLGVKGYMTMATRVQLPPKAKVTALPQAFTTTGPCFTVERTVSAAGSVVTMKTTYTKECTVLPPEAYPVFRTAVQEVVNRQEDYLLFK